MHNILASIFSAPSCSYYKYDNENMIRFFCLISLCMKEQGSSISEYDYRKTTGICQNMHY